MQAMDRNCLDVLRGKQGMELAMQYLKKVEFIICFEFRETITVVWPCKIKNRIRSKIGN
jgi:hypothetical protein